MARRLIGLLRDDETLPLREDTDLDTEELADPRCPPYMDAIPIAYPRDYATLLDTKGGTVRDAPAYTLLEWILTEPDPYEQGDGEEIVASIARDWGELAARGHAIVAYAQQSWRRCIEDGGFSPGDALSFDAGGVCSRRDDGLAELPALIQHRYDYLCAFNGDTSEDDNPFTHWDTAQWAASGLLAWSPDNVEDLAEKWAVVCDAQERTRMAWDALAAPDGLRRLIPLLEEVFGADMEADW